MVRSRRADLRGPEMTAVCRKCIFVMSPELLPVACCICNLLLQLKFSSLVKKEKLKNLMSSLNIAREGRPLPPCSPHDMWQFIIGLLIDTCNIIIGLVMDTCH
jgi:hypothetical protein